MSVFAISDLHLSFGTDKPMGVFGADWEGHIERLKKGWADVVKDGDTVIMPGDLSWGMNMQEALPDFKFLNELPGKKILLKGNHDYWWGTTAKMTSFLRENRFDGIQILHNNAYLVDNIAIAGTRGWFLEGGEPSPEDEKIFNREAGRLETSLRAARALGDYPIVVFLHFPVVYAGLENEQMLGLLESYKVRLCCYGHLHAHAKDRAFEGEYRGIEFKLVSADHLMFKPLLLSL
jgi:predicted phosphohydrolase